MNDPQQVTDEQFSDMIDRFVSLANELAKTLPPSQVSAALMFSAARFNAFNWLSREILLEQTLDQATTLHRDQYADMFRANADELTALRRNA